ncbi:hypothetical protein [Nannocystis bainbridge]|uniref:Uncharacterized protein n=1 Tax=Nannocystis bainbridge TaxID=2995303 RepID=A0ABT5E0M7_9BACT|nr:hypothetical protein [Nannocystis bainbridge]MDC0719427.1 hypothetical protein [Nannocystis bainbridge]
MEIVSRAVPPPGAAAIAPTRRGLRHLVELLAEGEPAARIEAVLSDAPAVVAEVNPKAAEFYGPEMFVGERWSRWCNDQARLAAKRQGPALAQRTAPACIEPARVDERAEVRKLLSLVETPRAPNLWEQTQASSLPAHQRALLFAPDAARDAARRLEQHATSQGRELALDELRAALAAVAPTLEPPRRRTSEDLEREEELELAERATEHQRRTQQLAALDEVARRDPAQAVLLFRSLLARGDLDDVEQRLVEQRLSQLLQRQVAAAEDDSR